jgi:hypothetical protein
MDIDQRKEDHFVYDLNLEIRAMVQMWKPSAFVEAVENAHYAEEHMGLNEGMGSTIPQ